MIDVKFILPIVIELIGAMYVYIELADTLSHFSRSNAILGSKKHAAEHVFLLMFLILCNVVFIVTLFTFTDIDAVVDMIINKGWWIVISLFGFLKIYTAYHLKGERTDRI